MSFAGVVFKRVVRTAFNEGDTFRCYGTHSAADGCAGLAALDFVRLTVGDRVKVSEGTYRE